MTYEEYKKKREQEEKERQDSYEQYKAARDAETEVPRIYSMMSDWQSRNNDYYNKYESTKNNASSFSSADQTAWEDYVSTTNRGFMNDAANILSLAEKHKDRLGEDYSKIKDTILVDVDNHSVIKKNAFSTGAQRAASDIDARLSALRTGQESFVKKYSDKADKFADGQTYFIGHDEWNEDVQRANVELADDAAGIIKLIDGASERYKDYFDAKGLGELKSMLEEGAESGWQIAGSAKNLNDFYSQWQNGGDFTLSKQAARNEGQGLWTLRAVYDNAKEVADKMDDIATKYADKRKYVGKKEDIVNDWGWTDNMSADDVRAYFERNYKNDDDRNAALDKYKEYTDYKYLQTQLDEITGGRTLGELASLIESEEANRIINAQDLETFTKEHPILANAASVALNLGSSVETAANLISYAASGGGNERMHGSKLGRLSSQIRGTTADMINLNIAGWDVADFVYQTTMSGIDSYLAGAMLGNIGAVSVNVGKGKQAWDVVNAAGIALGLSAAGQAANEAIDRGITGEDVFWTALVSGVNECLWESVSISQIKAMNEVPVQTIKDYAMNLVKSMATNFTEEAATEVANIVADAFINGDMSNFEQNVQAYMAQGLSEDEANKRALKDSVLQVLEAGGSGALMGAGFAGISSAQSYAANGRQSGSNAPSVSQKYTAGKNIIAAEDGAVLQALIDAGKTFDEKSAAYKLAEQLERSDGGLHSPINAANLTMAVSEQMNGQIADEIERELNNRGYAQGDTTRALAEEMARTVVAQNLIDSAGKTGAIEAPVSDFVRARIEADEAAANVFNEVVKNRDSVPNQKAATVANAVAAVDRAFSPAAQSESAAQDDTVQTQAGQNAEIAEAAPDLTQQAKPAENGQILREDGDAAQRAIERIQNEAEPEQQNVSDYKAVLAPDGSQTQIADVVKGEDGGLAVKLSDGSTVSASDTALSSPVRTMLDYANKKGFNELAAKTLIDGFGQSKTDVGRYIVAFDSAYYMGDTGVVDYSAYEKVTGAPVGIDALTRRSALELGRQAYEERQKTEAAKEERVRKAQAKNAKLENLGKVRFAPGVSQKLTAGQRAQVDYIRSVAETFGESVVLEKSMRNAKGDLILDGQGNACGWYDRKTGEIHLDLNGQAGEGLMLYTLAHEQAHEIRTWKPQQYRLLGEFLADQYAENGLDLDGVLQEYRELYPDLSADKQFEEFLGDSMQKMYADKNFTQAAEEYIARDGRYAEIFKKLADGVKRLLDKIKNIVSRMPQDTATRNMQRLPDSAVREFYSRCLEAVAEASQARAAAIAQAQTEDVGENENTADDGGVRTQARKSKSDPSKLDPRTVTEKDVRVMLENVKLGKYSDNSYIPIRINTPSRLIEWARKRNGDVIDNNPIVISAKKARQAMARDGADTDGRPHAISSDDVMNIVKAMDRPSYIIYQPNGRYVEIVEYSSENASKAVAILEMGDYKPLHSMNGYDGNLYNVLVTTFNPDSGVVSNMLKNKENKVIYDAKKDESQVAPGSTVPSVLNDTPFFTDDITISDEKSQEKVSDTEKRDQKRKQIADVYELAGENERLESENKALKKDVARLNRTLERMRLDNTQTNGEMLTKTSVDAAASVLMKKLGLARGKSETAKLLSDYYRSIVRASHEGELNWEDVFDGAMKVADGMYSLMPERKTVSDDYEAVRQELRTVPITFSDAQKSELAHVFGSYGDFVRQAFGRLNIVKEGGRSIDDVWQEMSRRYPGVFSADVVSDMDQAVEILEVYKNLSEGADLYGEYMKAEGLRAFAYDVYDSFWGVSQLHTRADRTAKEINLLKAEHRTQMDALKEKYEQRLKDEKQKYDRRIAEMREKRDEMLAKQKQHAADARANAVDRHRRTEMRHRITGIRESLVRMINNPTEKRHVPVELMRTAVEVLDGFNFATSDAKGTMQKLYELHSKYAAIKEDATYSGAYDETIAKMLSDVSQRVGNTAIKDMTLSQLQDVYDVLHALDHTIRDSLRMTQSNIAMTAYEASQAMIRETRNARIGMSDHGVKGISDEWKSLQLRPKTMFNLLGGYKKNSVWSQLYDMLDDGQKKKMQLLMEGEKIFDELLSDKRIKKLSNETVDIGLKDRDGNPVEISRGMMLSLYMHLHNAENARHAVRGGLTVPQLAAYYKGDRSAFGQRAVKTAGLFEELSEYYDRRVELARELGETEDADRRAELEEQIEALEQEYAKELAEGDTKALELAKEIESQLTDYEKQWIEKAKYFFDEWCKNNLNETTLAAYGFKKANVKDYFPIVTDGNFLRVANFETVMRQSLENVGFLKERMKASNPIILEDITKVIDRQLNNVAQYCGMMIPIRNFTKAYGAVDIRHATSVQDAIKNKFGDDMNKWIAKLMGDLSGNAKDSDGFSRFMGTVRGHSAQAVLSLNVRVALGQAASYPTAAAVLGWSPLAKALVKGGKNGWMFSRADKELIAKYSPLLWLRTRGISNYALADANGIGSVFDKTSWRYKAVFGWINAMDGATVGRLWYACQYYVDDNFSNLEKGSDEYYKKVAETFDRVIEETQPNYTTMQRTAIQRSKNEFAKSVQMFMTQRLQNVNILADSAMNYSVVRRDFREGKNGVTAQDVKDARNNLARAVSSQLVQNMVYTAMITLVNFIVMHNLKPYRDDDEEVTVESTLSGMLDTFLSTVFGNVIGGGEAYDIVSKIVKNEKYYGLSIGGLGTIVDFVKAGYDLGNSFADAISPDRPGDWNAFMQRAYNAALEVTQMFGIPASNAVKIATGIYNNAKEIRGAIDGTIRYGDVDANRSQEQKGKLLYEAVISGDAQREAQIRAEFGDDDKDDSALKAAFKKYDERVAQAAEAYANGDFETYERLAREIIGEGHFAADDVSKIIKDVAKGYSGADEQNNADEDAGDGSEKAQPDTVYQPKDAVTAFSAGDDELAYDIIQDVVKARTEAFVKNGESKEEAEKSAKSTMQQALTTYFKPLYLEACDKGDTSGMKVIADKMEEAGVYDDLPDSLQRWLTETYKKPYIEACDKGDTAAMNGIVRKLDSAGVYSDTKKSRKTWLTAYYKPLYLDAYDRNDETAMRDIRFKMKAAGVYGTVDDIIDVCSGWVKKAKK